MDTWADEPDWGRRIPTRMDWPGLVVGVLATLLLGGLLAGMWESLT